MDIVEGLKQYLPWRIVDNLPSRVWTGFLLGALGIPLGLALAYAHGQGIELLENGQYELIDAYVYNVAALTGVIGVSGSFYAYFRDVSSALAPAVGVLYGLHSGIQDILVYLVLPSESMPSVLPWLNDSHIGIIAQALGFDEVTRLALFTVVAVTGVFALVLVKILVEIEAQIYGINL